MVHQSHHVVALRAVIEGMINNQHQKKFVFTAIPTSKKSVQWEGSWGLRTNRIDLGCIYDNIMLEMKLAGKDEDIETNHQYNLTVDTCLDCNMVMTMQFWYRYHLYTSMEKNPNRIIPTGVITVKHATTVLHVPEETYDRKNDFFTAYIAYYLQLCLPAILTHPKTNLKNKVFKRAKEIHVKLCWVVLQTTCLICEYTMGAEKKGKYNQNPKSILGAIELYLSYFGWILACFRDPKLPLTLKFSTWHQFYFCDIYNSSTFRDPSVLLAKSIIPKECDIPSKQLVEIVGKKMLECFKRHMLPINNMLMQRFKGMQLVDLEHYICISDLDIVQSMSTQLGFDYMLQRVGVHALWSRVCILNIHGSPRLQKKMQLFLDIMQEQEINRLAKNNRMNDVEAYTTYWKMLTNPKDHAVTRGTWASVASLLEVECLGVGTQKKILNV
jgi:hypothetical protein